MKRLQAIAKTDLLIIDDWGLAPLTQRDRTDLLEILDDCVGSRSTIITSQLPPDNWHAWINDPTLADAILDRVLQASHRIALKGDTTLYSGPSESEHHSNQHRTCIAVEWSLDQEERCVRRTFTTHSTICTTLVGRS